MKHGFAEFGEPEEHTQHSDAVIHRVAMHLMQYADDIVFCQAFSTASILAHVSIYVNAFFITL